MTMLENVSGDAKDGNDYDNANDDDHAASSPTNPHRCRSTLIVLTMIMMMEVML